MRTQLCCTGHRSTTLVCLQRSVMLLVPHVQSCCRLNVVAGFCQGGQRGRHHMMNRECVLPPNPLPALLVPCLPQRGRLALDDRAAGAGARPGGPDQLP